MTRKIVSESDIEKVLEGTSWLEGFRHGHQDGFEIGVKLGLMTAIEELERLIAKAQTSPLAMASEISRLETSLKKLGWEKKPPN